MCLRHGAATHASVWGGVSVCHPWPFPCEERMARGGGDKAQLYMLYLGASTWFEIRHHCTVVHFSIRVLRGRAWPKQWRGKRHIKPVGPLLGLHVYGGARVAGLSCVTLHLALAVRARCGAGHTGNSPRQLPCFVMLSYLLAIQSAE